VGSIELDERTHELVRFAARMFSLSESEIVARAVLSFGEQSPTFARPRRDPWQPVELYGEYEGHRVGGLYLPATKRVTVTTPPLAGEKFKSPSGAARAVVAALNPERASTQTNGWRFWHLVETDERLEVMR
jgi:hypothetical protein